MLSHQLGPLRRRIRPNMPSTSPSRRQKLTSWIFLTHRCSTFMQRLADGDIARREHRADIAADHQADQLLPRGLRRGQIVQTYLPSRMTITRSEISKISSMRCEI